MSKKLVLTFAGLVLIMLAMVVSVASADVIDTAAPLTVGQEGGGCAD